MTMRLARSLNASQVAALARMFSARVVQDIARTGKSALLGRLVAEAPIVESLSPNDPIRNLFEVAFSILRFRHYRNEYTYKAAITKKILLGRYSMRTSVMLTEFRVGDRKADMVILNGSSASFEIKSERDKLDKLPEQIDAYLKVFSNANVVASEHHVDSVLGLVPREVGVLILTDRFQISTIRRGVDDPKRINPSILFESLRLLESRKILKLLGHNLPRVPNTQERALLYDRFRQLRPQQAHKCMLAVLKSTRSMSSLSHLVEELPMPLQALCISTPLRKQDHSRLLATLDAPMRRVFSWA